MKRPFLPRAFLLSVLLTGLVASCGGESGGTKRYTQHTAAGWSPSAITAVPGDPIIFSFNYNDRAEVASTAPAGLFDSGIKNRGQAYEWKVPKDIKYDVVQFEETLVTHNPGSITIVKEPP